MGGLQTTWGETWGRGVSLKRVAGFSLNWVWVLMVFYSIVPYLSSSDVRGSLYINLFVSLCAMVVTMLFIAILVPRDERVGSNRYVVVGAALIMCAGSVLTMFSDLTTTTGMLMLGISSIMTGTSSAVLFLAWIEVFSGGGGRLALIEISCAMCAAFVIAFALTIVPPLAADVAIVLLPPASALLLLRLKRNEHQAPSAPRGVISRQTIGLFVKALLGAALFGAIEGFFDVLSGYQTYAVQDIYGTYLFLAGFLAALATALIAVFLFRDSVSYTYRLAMLLLCAGCLFTPFMGDNSTYSTAFIFGGYGCFTAALCVVCINVSRSFNVGPTRAIGLGFVALYGGEVLGALCAHTIEAVGVSEFNLAVLTVVAVLVLLVSHLFLFTEIDLIRVGIGELDAVVVADGPERVSATGEGAGEAEGGPDPIDPGALIAERYGLSPRETEVLQLLLQGRTISRIQESLFISAGTVSTHIRHIYHKVGVENRQGLIDLVEELFDAPERTRD